MAKRKKEKVSALSSGNVNNKIFVHERKKKKKKKVLQRKQLGVGLGGNSAQNMATLS